MILLEQQGTTWSYSQREDYVAEGLDRIRYFHVYWVGLLYVPFFLKSKRQSKLVVPE